MLASKVVAVEGWKTSGRRSNLELTSQPQLFLFEYHWGCVLVHHRYNECDIGPPMRLQALFASGLIDDGN
jgi:hypothetical protein